MLYMILIKASQNAEDKMMPNPELMRQMDEYNDELEEAGVRVMAKGLHPSKEGLRIHFSESGEKTVEEGPFLPVKDVIAGFFLIEVSSKEEALHWFHKVPDPQGFGEGSIELREVY